MLGDRGGDGGGGEGDGQRQCCLDVDERGRAHPKLADHVDGFHAEPGVGDDDRRPAGDRTVDEHCDIGDRMLRAVGAGKCTAEHHGEQLDRGGQVRVVAVGGIGDRGERRREAAPSSSPLRVAIVAMASSVPSIAVTSTWSAERARARRAAVACGIRCRRSQHARVEQSRREARDAPRPRPVAVASSLRVAGP